MIRSLLRGALGVVRHQSLGALSLLLVLTGGTAYAAGLGRDTVGSAQIRNGSVGSADVRDGTLRATDLRPGVLRVGPVGPIGPIGPRGATGPSFVFNQVTSANDQPVASELDLVSSSVSVPQAGPLIVWVSAEVRVDCSGGLAGQTVKVAARVDGTVVPGTFRFIPASTRTNVVTAGVTAGEVVAGPHTVTLSIECVGAPTFSGASLFNSSLLAQLAGSAASGPAFRPVSRDRGAATSRAARGCCAG